MNPQPNQQPAHSPLPWHLDETKRFVYASNGEQVAAILPVTGSPKASIANAALIVRVNCHQALVDALTLTEKLADELIRRAREIDRRLIALDDRKPDCELGEIARLNEQLIKNREALRSATQ